MSGAVSTIRFSTLEEALVARGLLLARGVPVACSNRHHCGMNWFLTPALGGVGLSLPSCQLEEGRRAIAEALQEAEAVLSEVFGALETERQHRLWQRLRIISAADIWLGLFILWTPPTLFLLGVIYLLERVSVSIAAALGYYLGHLPNYDALLSLLSFALIAILVKLVWNATSPGKIPEDLEARNLPSFDL